MSQRAEFEYAKLLDDNVVDQELVNHPQFYQSFMRKYDDLSVDGRDAVEVSVGKDYIALAKRSDYPQATNGIYVGYKDVTSVTFTIEELHEHKYFRVDRECSSVYTFPKKGDSLSNSLDTEIYEENALLGRAYFGDLAGDTYGHNLTPFLGFRKPNLTAGYILQGMIPQGINYLVAGDYACHVAGRSSYEQGLVQKSSQSRRSGVYDGSFSVAAVNLENTMTIDNAADIVIYDKDMNMIRFNTYFKTPQEAKEATQERYEKAIGKSKSKVKAA